MLQNLYRVMIPKILLPNRFKKIGWFILIPSAIAGLIVNITHYEAGWLNAKVPVLFKSGLSSTEVFTFAQANLTFTITGSLIIIGSIFVAFSKEKKEDEYISGIRLSSLLWAVWINQIVLLLAFLFVYDFSFLTVMTYNMFTVMLLFIIRFNFILYRSNKSATSEK